MNKPLADRFRPVTLDDIVGQKHLLGEDKPLRRIIESGRPFAGSAAVPGGTGTRQRGFCLISFGNAYIISGKGVNRQWKIRDGFIKNPWIFNGLPAVPDLLPRYFPSRAPPKWNSPAVLVKRETNAGFPTRKGGSPAFSCRVVWV